MKAKSFLLALLIAISTLLFGVLNTVNAETINVNSTVQQVDGEFRVELKWINGVLWIIIYDTDENIIHASAVGHGD